MSVDIGKYPFSIFSLKLFISFAPPVENPIFAEELSLDAVAAAAVSVLIDAGPIDVDFPITI